MAPTDASGSRKVSGLLLTNVIPQRPMPVPGEDRSLSDLLPLEVLRRDLHGPGHASTGELVSCPEQRGGQHVRVDSQRDGLLPEGMGADSAFRRTEPRRV